MNQYNFNVLSPEEFEEFTKDLLSSHLGMEFSSFASGRDGGVDLRYSNLKTDETVIVQCKRYENLNNLMSALTKEAAKVNKMKTRPSRYILVISQDLSVEKVNKVIELFRPYISSDTDIFMPKRLNSILNNHKEIERRYYKLWLSSTNVLESMINRKIHNYTNLVVAGITKRLQTYSHTPSFYEALDALKVNGFVVIAGAAGVGKSTLAEVLSIYLLAKDHFDEFYALPRDIGEALQIINEDPNKKQVFLFDDFLGKNFHANKLDKLEDVILGKFLENISHYKGNKVLIFTTREYILNQARQAYDLFDDGKFSKAKYILNLSNYDKVTKAKILCNHIAASDLPQAYIDSFLNTKTYKSIISHKNYSPRLIESICNGYNWDNIEPKDIKKHIEDFFDKPFSLYANIYKNKIGPTERKVMQVLVTLKDEIRLDDLYLAVKSFDNNIDEMQFEKSLEILESTFIKIDRDDDFGILIDVMNPSIRDFLLDYHSSHDALIEDLINCAVFTDQLASSFRTWPLGAQEKDSRILLSEKNAEILYSILENDWDRLITLAQVQNSIGSGLLSKIYWSGLHRLSDDRIRRIIAEKVMNQLNSLQFKDMSISVALNIFASMGDRFKPSKDVLEVLSSYVSSKLDETYGTYILEEVHTLVTSDVISLKELGESITRKLRQTDVPYGIIFSDIIENHNGTGHNTEEYVDSINYLIDTFDIDAEALIYDVVDTDPPENYDSTDFYDTSISDFGSRESSDLLDADDRIDSIFDTLRGREI